MQYDIIFVLCLLPLIRVLFQLKQCTPSGRVQTWLNCAPVFPQLRTDQTCGCSASALLNYCEEGICSYTLSCYLSNDKYTHWFSCPFAYLIATMYYVEAFSVFAGVVAITRQGIRLLFSILFFTRHYGVMGCFLCIFDNRSIWRVQVRILKSKNDTDAMNFRRAAQDECCIIAVASTILAQIAITALSLDKLSRTPWVARGCFAFSLVSSIIAVYYATKQYCHLGRCLNADDVRKWIRNKDSDIDSQDPLGILFGRKTSEAERKFYENFPSVTSILRISAPNILLDSSLHSFVIGLAIYFAYIWAWNLDNVAGEQNSKAVYITYIVGLMLCYWAFALSNAVVADKSYVSEEEFIGEKKYRQHTRGSIERNDEENASDDRQHSRVQSVSSYEMTSNMAAEQGASTDALEESAQRQARRDSTTQSISIQEELAQVFREAARLRNESAKVDERLAQLMENLGRDTEG